MIERDDLKRLVEERLRRRDPIYGAEWLLLGGLGAGLAALWIIIWLA